MRLGVLGGGQLGRMLALAGHPLGIRFLFLDPSAAAPAGQVAELRVSAYGNISGLCNFARDVGLVTYEFENVPVAAVRFLAERVTVYPPPRALEVAQDRLEEKTLFGRLGIATAAFARVDSESDLREALGRLGLPAVLKTRRLGYDGKGQTVLRTTDDLGPAWRALGGTDLILEDFVAFEREVSILAVRGRDGATAFYPLVENRHHEGILRVSLAPAPRILPGLKKEAETAAGRVLDALAYVGVLAMEFFVRDDRLFANELAPRVHNSGHWTIDAAETSQFENHLRAILGWPLGPTSALGHSAMANIIGAAPEPAAVLAIPGARLHLYGKAARPGRKLGHVTVRAENEDGLRAGLDRLRALVDLPPTEKP